MFEIKNKSVCNFACKAEKAIEATILRKLFNTKNTLKDRVFMYIFLTSSIFLGMGIIGAKANVEQELVKAKIIPIENTVFAKMAIVK